MMLSLRGVPAAAILLLVLLALLAPPVAAQSSVPAGTQYVSSAQGRVYYWVGCPAWTRLKESNLRFFGTREAAEAAGYSPSQTQGCQGPDGALVPTESVGTATTCVVGRVVDGDTFVCSSGVRVRLLLIDAPETTQGNLGLRAKLALEELLPAGGSVRLEYDVQVRDRYGRALAHVHVDSLWINRQLVRRGYALVSVFPPNVRGVEALRAAADSARTENAGLWRMGGFDCTPAQHRRRGCK